MNWGTKEQKAVAWSERKTWDWSLSNCELGRQHGHPPSAIRYIRNKFGIPKFKIIPKQKVLGVDRKGALRPPIPLSREMFRQSFADGFLANVKQCGQDECWEWIAGRDKRTGYGVAYMRMADGARKQFPAHRVSYALFNGPIPDGLLVMHTCDNKQCVNPRHLLPGTDLTNSRDASNKGLMHPGVKTFGAVLNDDVVRTIRARSKSGERINDIARASGHHRRTVADVINNKTWRHVW